MVYSEFSTEFWRGLPLETSITLYNLQNAAAVDSSLQLSIFAQTVGMASPFKLPSQCKYCSLVSRGLQRDVIYLCWPIAPSYTSPNARGKGGCCWSQPMSTAVQSCGDLPPYLTYARIFPQVKQDGNQGCALAFRPLCSVLLQPAYSIFPSQLKRPRRGGGGFRSREFSVIGFNKGCRTHVGADPLQPLRSLPAAM